MPDRDHSRSLLSDLFDGAEPTVSLRRPHARPAIRPRRGRAVVAMLGGLAAFTVVTLGLVLLGRLVIGDGARQVTAGRPVPAPVDAVAAPAGDDPGSIVPGHRLSRAAAREDGDCAAHAYGRTQEFFRATPCAGLRRALYTGVAEGVPVVVSVSTVAMRDSDDAAALQELVDTSGTGNVSDLLREGVVLPGGPSELNGAGYASRREGAEVVIVETAPRDGDAPDGDLLDRTSEAMLPLGG